MCDISHAIHAKCDTTHVKKISVILYTRNYDELPESSQRAPREFLESSQRAPRQLTESSNLQALVKYVS